MTVKAALKISSGRFKSDFSLDIKLRLNYFCDSTVAILYPREHRSYGSEEQYANTIYIVKQ